MRTSRFVVAWAAILVLGGCASKDMLLSNQGFELLSVGNDSEAGVKLQQALAVNPDNPYALLNMGVVYQRMERPEKARRMYEKVLALEPEERAEASNNPSFSGKSLGEIAASNLALLEGGGHRSPVAVSPSPTGSSAQSAPEGQGGEQEALGESDPEYGQILYIVPENQTLLEIAARPEVYGDPFKWPTLFRLNMDTLPHTEDLLRKPVRKGTLLRIVDLTQVPRRAASMNNRLWVVNAASVRTFDKTIQPATLLMGKGHRVYLMNFSLGGEEWIRLRVGFYESILEAMAACEEIRPLMLNAEEVCVSRIEVKEFEENAGY